VEELPTSPAQRSVMSINKVSEESPEAEPTVSPKLDNTADMVSADERPQPAVEPELPIPRWVVNLIGHVLAALLGLILGYLILAWRYPLRFPLPWYH
jgi:hypothetical protein